MPEPMILMCTKGKGHGARTRNSCTRRGRATVPDPKFLFRTKGRAATVRPVTKKEQTKGEGHGLTTPSMNEGVGHGLSIP